MQIIEFLHVESAFQKRYLSILEGDSYIMYTIPKTPQFFGDCSSAKVKQECTIVQAYP